jgi:hypothetical protein
LTPDQILSDVKAGDPASLRNFYDGNKLLVEGFCARLFSERELPSAVMATFQSAFELIQEGKGPERDLRTWLLGVAAQRCLEMLSADHFSPQVDEGEPALG